MIRSSISVRTTGQRDRAEGEAVRVRQQDVRGSHGLLKCMLRSTDYCAGSVIGTGRKGWWH